MLWGPVDVDAVRNALHLHLVRRRAGRSEEPDERHVAEGARAGLQVRVVGGGSGCAAFCPATRAMRAPATSPAKTTRRVSTGAAGSFRQPDPSGLQSSSRMPSMNAVSPASDPRVGPLRASVRQRLDDLLGGRQARRQLVCMVTSTRRT